MHARPALADTISLITMQDEAVLYDAQTGDLHRLDPIATAVCNLFDGTTTIDEIVALLTDAFDAPFEVVDRDVRKLIGDLDQRGVLHSIPERGSPDSEGPVHGR